MKRNRKILKNNLDEMQEQKLLHIEKTGFWMLYILIAFDLIIKVMTGVSKKDVLVELLCFMAVGIYTFVMCVKNGIWDRHIQAGARTNIVVSIISGLIVAVLYLIDYAKRSGDHYNWKAAAGAAGFSGLLTTLITLLLLCLGTAFYQRRVRVLEEESEDEE